MKFIIELAIKKGQAFVSKQEGFVSYNHKQLAETNT